MIAEFQSELQKHFPKRKIRVTLEASTEFKPYLKIEVDGKQVKAEWNVELALDLKAMHNIETEREIFGAMIDEIKHELGM